VSNGNRLPLGIPPSTEAGVAKKRIPTSRFILESKGVVVDPEAAEDKSYILEIPGVGFVDAKNSSGKHKFVNHCCDGKSSPTRVSENG
jgi:hypothetical protein